MTLPLRTAEIRRLAFVKYVLSVAHEQSRQSEPNCSLALLQFHDGLELLLQLAAERLNVRVERNTAFLGYWPLLGPALGRDLPHHGAMKRLNEARVGLKHHGHLLARLDVSELGEVTDTFVREIVPLVFGLPWDQVSQADFIHSERARDLVRAAEDALARRDFDGCRIECRKAYETLMTEYSPFRRHEEAIHPRMQYEVLGSLNAPTQSAFEWIMVELWSLRQEVGALATGLNPRRVKHFLDITPIVAHSANWKWHVVGAVTRPSATAAEAAFCLEFVLDAAEPGHRN